MCALGKGAGEAGGTAGAGRGEQPGGGGASRGGHRWIEQAAWGPGLFLRKQPHVLAQWTRGGGCPSPKRGCWLWAAPHAHLASRWTVQWRGAGVGHKPPRGPTALAHGPDGRHAHGPRVPGQGSGPPGGVGGNLLQSQALPSGRLLRSMEQGKGWVPTGHHPGGRSPGSQRLASCLWHSRSIWVQSHTCPQREPPGPGLAGRILLVFDPFSFAKKVIKWPSLIESKHVIVPRKSNKHIYDIHGLY